MKIVTEYEVEGAWSSLKNKSKCRLCGTVLEPVPRDGHFNSQYWRLERNDGQILKCCPEGCSEQACLDLIKYFKIVYQYCKPNAQPYDFELDYSLIPGFWMDRKGIIYPCGKEEHVYLADEYFNKYENQLEEAGFVRFSSDYIACDKRPSKAQRNAIYKFLEFHGEDITKAFEKMEEWKLDSIYIEIKSIKGISKIIEEKNKCKY